MVFVIGGCGGSSDLVLTDANNYSYTGELTIERVPIAPLTDATVDWSAVTVDIRGRELDPTTVQQLAVLGVPTAFDETIGQIERNELDSSQEAHLHDNDGGTDAVLSEFVVFNNYLAVELLEVEADTTWLVSLLNVADGQNDLLMSAVFVPTEGSDNHEIRLTNDSAALEAEVDLHSATALSAKAGGRPSTLDWTDLANDVFGHPYNELLGDRLVIGHYATEDIGEIEAGFLQLDTNADALYRADVYGTTGVDLEEAVDANGVVFPGFSKDGTWIVGLFCTTCITPVPLLLSRVDVN